MEKLLIVTVTRKDWIGGQARGVLADTGRATR